MKAFYDKWGHLLKEKDALCMIHKTLHKALKMYKKGDKDYCVVLQSVEHMIHDYLSLKEYNKH